MNLASVTLTEPRFFRTAKQSDLPDLETDRKPIYKGLVAILKDNGSSAGILTCDTAFDF